jgi:Flp pilus assembly protein TadG
MSRYKSPPRNKSNFWTAVRRFCQDQAGSYAVMFALMAPVLVGLSGLGTEVGVWFFKQRDMQGAADSSAVSAAIAKSLNLSDLENEAESVASSNGYTNGVNGTQVTVNRPPASGAFTAVSDAVEVIVQQPQQRLMSLLYKKDTVLIRARAVAIPRPGKGCVLALDPNASRAAEVSGTAHVSLDCGLYSNSGDVSSTYAGGSGGLEAFEVRASGNVEGQENITTEQGIFENQTPTADPYADATFGTMPSTCTQSSKLSVTSSMTLNAGRYCGGIDVLAGKTLTLNPGIYYIDKKDFKVAGGATLKGTGVTLVFTGSGANYATMKVSGGATVELSAPDTGPTAGIVIFGDRAMPTDTTFELLGGSNQDFKGAIYTPRSLLKFAGGADSKTSCTQVVTRVITFSGNAKLDLNCGGVDIIPFGSNLAELVE